jgi:type II secretory ATPase GspE/PulE/Tfp pilus assembly ATPase PilB-like protein
LRDLGIGDFLLASALSCVVAQRLVRRLCPYCKTPHALAAREAEAAGLAPDALFRHAGCDHCHHTGYLGRTAVAEVLEIGEELRHMIDAGASPLEIKHLAESRGMQTLRQAALRLVAAGITDLDEIDRVVRFDATRETAGGF